MTEHVELTIPGTPVPWQRARSNGKRRFKSSAVVEFEKRVQTAWLIEGKPRFEAGVALTLCAHFYFPRLPTHLTSKGALRKGAPHWPRPDLDNLLKLAAGDALNGLLWHDDSQIVCLSGCQKSYAEPGEEPWSELRVWPL